MKWRDDFLSSLPLKQNLFEIPKKLILALKSKDPGNPVLLQLCGSTIPLIVPFIAGNI